MRSLFRLSCFGLFFSVMACYMQDSRAADRPAFTRQFSDLNLDRTTSDYHHGIRLYNGAASIKGKRR